MAVVRDGQYKVLATLAQMPPYPELKQMATKLVTDGLPQSPPTKD